ncbi:hypothetical protein M1D96_06600 [Pseudomonas sp. D1-3]
MALIKHHKYVAALPATLEANAIYYVRAGDGFDLYVTNSSGQIVAYPANSKWDALKSPAIASGALIIDLATPAGFRVALNQNVATLSFANVPSGRVVVFTITWVQDATGGRTVAFPTSVKADGGTAPVQPAAGPNSVTVQSFYTDDGGATVWQAGPGSSEDWYQSNLITYVNGGSFSLNHGLSAAPRHVWYELVCAVAERGYSVGDVLEFPMGYFNSGSSFGISIRKTAAQLLGKVALHGISVLSLSDSQIYTVSASNWRIVVRAIK